MRNAAIMAANLYSDTAMMLCDTIYGFSGIGFNNLFQVKAEIQQFSI